MPPAPRSASATPAAGPIASSTATPSGWPARSIRVADIDAPETHDFRCAEERDLGNRATRRLRQLLNGGAVSLQAIDRDEDRYGRKLRVVLVDGRSVGDLLVGEGLARPYEGGRRPWC